MPRLTQAQRDANEAREERGRRLLSAYVHIQNETRDADEEDDQVWLTDMLADLRHWAAAEKLDFDRALATSQIHFNCERNGEG